MGNVLETEERDAYFFEHPDFAPWAKSGTVDAAMFSKAHTSPLCTYKDHLLCQKTTMIVTSYFSFLFLNAKPPRAFGARGFCNITHSP